MVNKTNLHSVRVDLAGEIRQAVNEFATENHLEKEFACQILILKTLRNENRISKEVYEFYLSRYSKPIMANTPFQQASTYNSKPHSINDLKAQQKLDEMSRYFQGVLNQWSIHPSPEWRSKTLLVAQEWKDKIPSAKLVLDLGGGQMVLNVVVPQKQKELDP